MAAASKISRLAVGDTHASPSFDTYDIPKMMVQEDRASEDLPFGTRGGAAVHHYFPVDGDDIIRVRLRKQLYGYILGMGRAQQIDVRLDGQRIKLFTIGGDAPGKPVPNTYAADIPTDPQWEEYMHSADRALDVRLPVKAGPHVVGVSFARQFWEPEGVLRPPERTRSSQSINSITVMQRSRVSRLAALKYNRPGDTPSRRRILCLANPVRGRRRRGLRNAKFSQLWPGALTADPSPVRMSERCSVSTSPDATHGGFDAGIQFALETYARRSRFSVPDRARPGDMPRPARSTASAISNWRPGCRSSCGAASRMTNCWMPPPPGKLTKPASWSTGRANAGRLALERVDRRFREPWLGTAQTRLTEKPDPRCFRNSMRICAVRSGKRPGCSSKALHDDRSVLELLNANYSFVNERLARHYQIPRHSRKPVSKVTFGDGRRGGLLGQGSILMITSYPNRTSPVLRGKWVLDNLLGTPPPPPPPNIPALKENSETGKSASMRQLMEEHRNNPACSVCHSRMDPIGFSLENFDALGRWRVRDAGAPIDPSGVLPDGTGIDGAAGLKKTLLAHPQQFVNTFTEKLLTYALGREVEYYDLPAVRKIDREAAANGYRWSFIIEKIVNSTPFQMSIVHSAPIRIKESE